MKQPIKILLMTILLCNLNYASQLVFCSYPYKSNKAIYEQYQPLLKHLEEQLNQTVNLTIAKDYNNQIELLLSNKVQIAILGPYNFVKAKKADANLHYIATQQYLKNKKMISSYYSVIVASKNSGIESIEELKGKRFGFTDFNSTSGYLFPSLVLKEHDIQKSDFSEHFMLKKHPHIMEALTRNSIDAGATHLENYLTYIKKYGNKFKILYTSEPIPYDAIVVSSHVSKELKEKIQKAILSYAQTVNGKKIFAYIKKNESVYDVVKRKAGELQ